jgi:hypothetical protein
LGGSVSQKSAHKWEWTFITMVSASWQFIIGMPLQLGEDTHLKLKFLSTGSILVVASSMDHVSIDSSLDKFYFRL